MTQIKKRIDRSGAGLRDALFDMLERLRDRTASEQEAGVFAKVAREINESAKTQLEFEKLKLENKVPQHLSEMKMVPPLLEAPKE